MNNNSKHISKESLKFYKSNLISIKLGPAYFSDLNPIENMCELIKKEMNSKSFNTLAEVQRFVENAFSKAPTKILKN